MIATLDYAGRRRKGLANKPLECARRSLDEEEAMS